MEGQALGELRRSSRIRKRQANAVLSPRQPGSSNEVKSIKNENLTRRKQTNVQSHAKPARVPSSTTRNKRKLQGPKEPEKVTRRKLANPKANAGSMGKALRMGEILHKIFIHLPNNLLLSSCSLVSKIWNTESRRFIRNYRICTFTGLGFGTSCQDFRVLAESCGEILRSGRVIPFNRLQIEFTPFCCDGPKVESNDNLSFPSPDGSSDEEDSDEGNASSKHEIHLQNVASAMKLKYLKISGRDCVYHETLASLLNHSSGQLRSLVTSIYSLQNPFQNGRTNEWHPQLSRLEQLIIANEFAPPGLEEMHKDILRWMLKDAPNLKKIGAGGLDVLSFVPEETLPLVELEGKLAIRVQSKEDFGLFRKISQKKFCLSDIRIHKPSAGAGGLYGIEFVDLCKQFDIELRKFFQNYHLTLRAVEIVGAYPLGKFSHPPLLNVSKLAIRRFEEKLDELWDVIASINFERVMPRLEEVKVTVVDNTEEDDAFYSSDGWPVTNNEYTSYCCTSVRKLVLDVQVRRMNLRPFQALFPNVSVLNLNLKGHNWSDPSTGFGTIGEIWECWPQLEELKIIGCKKIQDRNYDLDFCGIHKAEANALKRKGKKYLENVRIVPIRPCLLTMTKLLKLEFEDGSQSGSGFFAQAPGQRQTFVSKLTLLLALNRMPDLDVTLP